MLYEPDTDKVCGSGGGSTLQLGGPLVLPSSPYLLGIQILFFILLKKKKNKNPNIAKDHRTSGPPLHKEKLTQPNYPTYCSQPKKHRTWQDVGIYLITYALYLMLYELYPDTSIIPVHYKIK